MLDQTKGLSRQDQIMFAEIYQQLKPHASRLLAYHQGATLNTTGLVHESFLKLLRLADAPQDQRHLYQLAILAMRQILLDRVRAKNAVRRGGEFSRIDLADVDKAHHEQPFDVVLFDQTLEQLNQVSPRMAEVFQFRVLAGLEFQEIADLVGVAEVTVRRDYRAAGVLLKRWMGIST